MSFTALLAHSLPFDKLEVRERKKTLLRQIDNLIERTHRQEATPLTVNSDIGNILNIPTLITRNSNKQIN